MAIRAFRYATDTATTDLNINLYSAADALISSFLMSEIGSTGIYRADVNLTSAMDWGTVTSASKNIKFIFKNPYLENSTDIANTIFGRSEWINTDSKITTIRDIEAGKWEIINDQMIFYAQDNLTEVARFNLFDAAGQPSEVNVYKREKV